MLTCRMRSAWRSRTSAKMAGGQPTKYNPEYCQQLIDHMAQGNPFETFGVLIGTHRDTLFEWAKVHPEFSDAKKRGKDAQYHFLFQIGKAGTVGQRFIDKANMDKYTAGDGRFNAVSWIFIMKNCAGWKNNVEFTDSDWVEEVTFERTDGKTDE